MTSDESSPADQLPAAGGAVLGGLIGLAIGGPVGGLVGAALTPYTERLLARSREEFRRRGDVIAGAAASVAGVPEDQLVVQVVNDPALQPLVLRILDAAARTNQPQKLAALGAVLGDAASGRQRSIDEDLIIVAALHDLEPVHVRLLQVLARTSSEVLGDTSGAWTADALQTQLVDLSPALVQGALGGLIRHGLVRSLSLYGAVGYDASDFGRAMLGVFALAQTAG